MIYSVKKFLADHRATDFNEVISEVALGFPDLQTLWNAKPEINQACRVPWLHTWIATRSGVLNTEDLLKFSLYCFSRISASSSRLDLIDSKAAQILRFGSLSLELASRKAMQYGLENTSVVTEFRELYRNIRIRYNKLRNQDDLLAGFISDVVQGCCLITDHRLKSGTAFRLAMDSAGYFGCLEWKSLSFKGVKVSLKSGNYKSNRATSNELIRQAHWLVENTKPNFEQPLEFRSLKFDFS